MSIAYLNSEYPSLSHTFIEREIRHLRSLGFDLITYSVRRPGHTGTIGSAHARAASESRFVLDGLTRLIASFAGGLVSKPLGVMRAFLAGQRLSPPGTRARIWHMAYAIEAIRTARMLSQDKIKHVHVHMANNAAMIALLATKFDRRLSYSLSIHGSAEFFHVDDWRLAPKAQNARFVRCISEFCRAQIMTCTPPESWERFHVVRCGVDTSEFTPPQTPTERDADAPLRLLTVGRMHPIKGYDVLLRALAELRSADLRFKLTMVGAGPMASHLKSLAAELRLEEHVAFAGPVAAEDLKSYLDHADVMVVSSFMEGVPVVLMEAMACGMPVIATRVGGIPELVTDGVSGMLVDPGSLESLARAIQTLAEDPQRRRSMGKAGREAVIARYDIGQTARGMADLFSRYLLDTSEKEVETLKARSARHDDASIETPVAGG